MRRETRKEPRGRTKRELAKLTPYEKHLIYYLEKPLPRKKGKTTKRRATKRR